MTVPLIEDPDKAIGACDTGDDPAEEGAGGMRCGRAGFVGVTAEAAEAAVWRPLESSESAAALALSSWPHAASGGSPVATAPGWVGEPDGAAIAARAFASASARIATALDRWVAWDPAGAAARSESSRLWPADRASWQPAN